MADDKRIQCGGVWLDCTYLTQLLEHTFLDAAVLKIGPRCVDHIVNDLLIDSSDASVRHFDEI